MSIGLSFSLHPGRGRKTSGPIRIRLSGVTRACLSPATLGSHISFVALLCSCFLASLVSGCSLVTVGPDGTRRVMGLVYLELPPARPRSPAADALRVRSLGLAFPSSADQTSLSLGYTDETLARIRNNSCLRVDALTSGRLGSQ